eukprot:gene5747-6450_t
MNKLTIIGNDIARTEKEEDKDVISTCAGNAKVSSKSGADNIASSSQSSIISGKPELLVGDLVWSKIPGHAWWPSMVSYEPNKAVYFQSSSKGKGCFKYHVQFFGDDPLRGWVSDKSMVKFQGRDSFMKYSLTSMSKKDKALHSKQLVAWEQALVQAEKALPLNRHQRKLCYVFKYNDEPASQKASKKSQHTQSKKKDKSPKKIVNVNAKPRLTRRSAILDKSGSSVSMPTADIEEASGEKQPQLEQNCLVNDKISCLRSSNISVYNDGNCNLITKGVKQVIRNSDQEALARFGGSAIPELKQKQNAVKKKASIKSIDKEIAVKSNALSSSKKNPNNKQAETPECKKRKLGIRKSNNNKKILKGGKIRTRKQLTTKKITKKLQATVKRELQKVAKASSKQQEITEKEVQPVKSLLKQKMKCSLIADRKNVTIKELKEKVNDVVIKKSDNDGEIALETQAGCMSISDDVATRKINAGDEHYSDEVTNGLKSSTYEIILTEETSTKFVSTGDSSGSELQQFRESEIDRNGASIAGMENTTMEDTAKLACITDDKFNSVECGATNSLSSSINEQSENENEERLSRRSSLRSHRTDSPADHIVCNVLPLPELDYLFDVTGCTDQVKETSKIDLIRDLDFEAEIPLNVTWNYFECASAHGCSRNEASNDTELERKFLNGDKKMDNEADCGDFEEKEDRVASCVDDEELDKAKAFSPGDGPKSIVNETEDERELEKEAYLPYSTNDDLMDTSLVKSNKYICGYSEDEVVSQSKNSFNETEATDITWSDANTEDNGHLHDSEKIHPTINDIDDSAELSLTANEDGVKDGEANAQCLDDQEYVADENPNSTNVVIADGGFGFKDFSVASRDGISSSITTIASEEEMQVTSLNEAQSNDAREEEKEDLTQVDKVRDGESSCGDHGNCLVGNSEHFEEIGVATCQHSNQESSSLENDLRNHEEHCLEPEYPLVLECHSQDFSCDLENSRPGHDVVHSCHAADTQNDECVHLQVSQDAGSTMEHVPPGLSANHDVDLLENNGVIEKSSCNLAEEPKNDNSTDNSPLASSNVCDSTNTDVPVQLMSTEGISDSSCYEESCDGKEVLPNNLLSMFSSAEKNVAEPVRDMDESCGNSDGTSKRLRKRKTMSDFLVGLAFDEILSKRKRKSEKKNESKVTAHKKRRSTAVVAGNFDNKDSKEDSDNKQNENTEHQDADARKPISESNKEMKQIENKKSLATDESTRYLNECIDGTVDIAEHMLESWKPDAGSDERIIPEKVKKTGVKRMQACKETRVTKKQINGSDKKVKRTTKSQKTVLTLGEGEVSGKLKKEKFSNDKKLSTDMIVALSEEKDGKLQSLISHCETKSSEITSGISDSGDSVLPHFMADWQKTNEPSTNDAKQKKNKKVANGKKRKQDARDSIEAVTCDNTESPEVSTSVKQRKDLKSSRSPLKKKPKTMDARDDGKKRKYGKKKSTDRSHVKAQKSSEPIEKNKKTSTKRVEKKCANTKSPGKSKMIPAAKEKINSLSSTVEEEERYSMGESSGFGISREKVEMYSESSRLDTLSNYSEQVDDALSISGKDVEELGKLKKDSVCVVCELGDGLIFCNGVCLSSFHPDCLGLTTVPEKFFCDECLIGNHSCFLCKESGNTRKCSLSSCGKFYHEECATRIPASKFESSKLVCPLHNCATCTSEKDSSSSKKKLIRCVRCPTAYHAVNCLVAGCMLLNNSLMVCSKHFVPNKNKPHHAHYNVSWCFVCSSGGMLVCCESCPAAFHPGCVEGLDGVPDEAWQCDSCRNGRKPLCGDLIWVKYGFWRWWPAKICFPDEVPLRIQKLSHDVGEFPVMFFGSHDYCWLHSGRVFPYQEGDKGAKTKSSSGTQKIFSRALNEVEEAYKALKEIKDKELEQQLAKQSRKPPPYKHIKVKLTLKIVLLCLETEIKIKTNRYITAPRPVGDPELAHCECSPNAENPCGPGSECLNRMLQIECDKTCRAGSKCQNQRFQKCQHVDCGPKKTAGRGWGLMARQDIKKGDFVIEYVGELIDDATCRKRINDYHDNGISDYYFLVIDKDCIIDAYPKGNQSRFINHSCDPNCDTQKWTVNGEIRVGLFANKNIETSSELTFNYNLDTLGNEKKACRCGSKNCSGFLGVRPKTQNALALKEKKKAKTKKKKKKDKPQTIPGHEDECYICGDGGELIMCDKATCCKCYHLKCLTLSGMPRGRWECPWHFCDVCGKKANLFCNLCSNSFCTPHSEGQIFQVEPGVFVCDEHGDDNHGHSNNFQTQDSSVTSSTPSINEEDTQQHHSTVTAEEDVK